MNIYIANLSYEVNDSDLKELFAQYGTVTSAKVINDRDTGRSRGFGFVEMSNKEEALKAINELNNATYDGKTISVNEARPKTDRGEGGGGYGNNRGSGGSGGGFRGDRRPKSW